MTKLILHIGLQKTGTTFLQHNFLGRARRLRNVGVHYLSPQGNLPTKKVSAAHHWLVAAVRNLPNDYIPDVPFSFLPQYVEKLRAKIERNDFPITLMSSENFSRMNDTQVAELRRPFEGIETEVVIYLRRQDIWIDSWYAQMVKTGRKISLAQAIEDAEDFLDFRNIIDRWAQHFGEDRIRIGLYENFETPKALWDDFFETIGCPDAKYIDLQEQSANVTLSPELTKFIEIAQETTGYNPMLRRFLENVNSHFERADALKFITASCANRILERYEEPNKEIATKFFGREQLFSNMTVVGSDRDTNLSLEDIVKIVAGINMALLNRISNLEKALNAKPPSPTGDSGSAASAGPAKSGPSVARARHDEGA